MKYTIGKNVRACEIREINNPKSGGVCVVGENIKQIVPMIKGHITNMMSRNNSIIWNEDELTQVKMYNELEYTNNDVNSSEYIDIHTVTITGLNDNKKITIHNQRKIKNPQYNKNGKCINCDVDNVKLYNSVLLGNNPKIEKVCSKCKNQITRINKIKNSMF